MMALVRAVMFCSSLAASSKQVSGSISTNTGVAPARTIISAVAANVNGVVMTSSPGPIPMAIKGISNASVPEEQVMQWRLPV